MNSKWPFIEPRTCAAFTSYHVIERGHPIVFVTHDDDGDWQFLSAEMANSTQDGRVAGLGTIVDGDPTLLELWDLPLGWVATRAAVGAPWARARS